MHSLETLREVFCVRVPDEYTIERIMADEHHVVAVSRLGNDPSWQNLDSRQWFMSFFDLATLDEIDFEYVARGDRMTG